VQDQSLNGARRTNPLAVISFIAGLFWFGGLGSIVAVVVGTKARQDIVAGGRAESGWGLATAGIVLGWIGILAGVVGMFALCSARTGTQIDSPIERRVDRVTVELNITSALEDAARQERRYHNEEGSFTLSQDVITEEGVYSGVTIEVIRADDDSFCIEASSAGYDKYWHITDADRKPRRGRC
jgi:hypothetical protein